MYWYAIICSEDLFAASQISWKLDSFVAGIFLILVYNLFLKSINKIFANAQFQIFLKKVAKQKAQSPISQSTCSRSESNERFIKLNLHGLQLDPRA